MRDCSGGGQNGEALGGTGVGPREGAERGQAVGRAAGRGGGMGMGPQAERLGRCPPLALAQSPRKP